MLPTLAVEVVELVLQDLGDLEEPVVVEKVVEDRITHVNLLRELLTLVVEVGVELVQIPLITFLVQLMEKQEVQV
jgi:hypothetical protein